MINDRSEILLDSDESEDIFPFATNSNYYSDKTIALTDNLHYDNHSNQANYKCVYCSKEYPSYLHLKRHIKLHSKVKPYVCDLCSKSFVQSIDLIRHRRIHTGERPYKCEMCNYSAVQSSHLLKHLRSKHGVQNLS